MVALALYALTRTEELAVRRWALGLGLVLGLGMLTKPPFAAYLSGPLLWAAWTALRAPDRRARLLHLLAAVGVAAAVALPWYGPRLVGLPAQFINRSFKQAAEAGQAAALSGSSLLFYPAWIDPPVGPPGDRAPAVGDRGARAAAAGPRAPVGRADAVRDLHPHPEQEPALHPAAPARRGAGGGGGGERVPAACSTRPRLGLRGRRGRAGGRGGLRPASADVAGAGRLLGGVVLAARRAGLASPRDPRGHPPRVGTRWRRGSRWCPTTTTSRCPTFGTR